MEGGIGIAGVDSWGVALLVNEYQLCFVAYRSFCDAHDARVRLKVPELVGILVYLKYGICFITRKLST